jgi:hypothetical protein
MSVLAKVVSSGVSSVSSSVAKTGSGAKPVKGRRGTSYNLSSIAEEPQAGTAKFDDVKVATKVFSSGVPSVSSSVAKTERGAKPVKGRRGTLYHLSSITEERQARTATLDDVKVRRRFATNRYFLSPAGILKLLIIVSTVPSYLYRVVLHA